MEQSYQPERHHVVINVFCKNVIIVAQTIPKLHYSYVLESMVQAKFGVGNVGNKYKMSLNMHIQGSPVETQDSNTLEPDLPQQDGSAPCYRPKVIFRHICPVALPFPQRKTLRAFQKHFFFKLRKSGTMLS